MCDLGPQALSLPSLENRSVWIVHSELEERRKARKQKAPGSSPAAWYSESVGPGLLELVAAHALTPRARDSREPS